MTKKKFEAPTSEVRMAAAPIELREAVDGEAGGVTVTGYAAVFNEWTDIGGMWDERVAPGAFDDVMAEDVRFLINHKDLPLARVSSGNLRLSIDERGLKVEADLDGDDPDVARLLPKMRRGDVREMSYAYGVASDTWDETGPKPRRTINKLSAFKDVSVVTAPAYAGTSINLRSLEDALAESAARNLKPASVVAAEMRLRLAENS